MASSNNKANNKNQTKILPQNHYSNSTCILSLSESSLSKILLKNKLIKHDNKKAYAVFFHPSLLVVLTVFSRK